MIGLLLLAGGLGCDGDAPPGESAAGPDSGQEDTAVDTAVADTAADSGPPDSGDTADTALPDADGDGVPDDLDCAPSDAAVYPGAPEWCDTVDQDCDGEPLAEGVCGEAQTLTGQGVVISTYSGGFTLVPDVDGDGVSDLATFTLTAPDPSGGQGLGMSLYLGRDIPEPPFAAPAEAAFHLVEGGGACWTDNAPHPAGDVNGDGYPDVAIISHDCSEVVDIHFGPLPTDGSSRWMGDGDVEWSTATGNWESWWYEAAMARDFDGDGKDDMAGLAADDDVALDVLFGGEWGESRVRLVAGIDRETYRVNGLGDIDGDGMADIQLARAGTTVPMQFVLSGTDLRGADGADPSEIAIASVPWEPTEAIGQFGTWEDEWNDAGDWNDDGLDDITVDARSSETGGPGIGEVFLLDGGSTRGAFLPDDVAIGSWVATAGGYTLYVSAHADINGDGREELYLQQGDSEWLVPHVAPALRSEATGIHFADGNQHLLRGRGDFDGDGREDLSFSSYPEARDDSNAYLWLGWDVPWDEPQWW